MRANVNHACLQARLLPCPAGVPARKWTRAKKIFVDRLTAVLRKMEHHDTASLPYFEGRIRVKIYGGASQAVTRILHKFVGL